MLRFLQSFLIIVGLYFVVQTFVLYGLGYNDARWLWFLGKDILRFGLVVYVVFRHGRDIWSRLQQFRLPVLLVVLLGGRSFYLAFVVDQSLFHFLVGFKYDRYYIVILLSSAFVGYTLVRHKEFSVSSFVVFVCLLCLGLVLGGFVWQGLKLFVPDVFVQYLGYGSFGDFVPGLAPPLYYLTGPDGVTRFSGLFAGPNVLGFFLVLFGMLLLWFVRHRIRFVPWLFSVLLVFAIVLTLSRGALVAFVIASGLSVWLFYSMQYRKRILLTLCLLIGGGGLIYLINFTKTGSNLARGSAIEASQSLLSENVLGYGLGFTGPAQHYRDDYIERQNHPLSLLENIYLQLLVNIGAPGFVLRCLFWMIVFYAVMRVARLCLMGNAREYMLGVALTLMTLGLFALLVEGLVLHVFRDSMVNYIFFVSYGVLWGYAERLHHRTVSLSDDVSC